jgi:hypothetical protein
MPAYGPRDVCFWHKADTRKLGGNGRFRPNCDMVPASIEMAALMARRSRFSRATLLLFY